MNKNYLYLIIFSLCLLVIFLLSNKTIDVSNGGVLEGKSHENGGIRGVIKATNKKIVVEGNEVIENKRSMGIVDKYLCQGNPKQIASALNRLNRYGVNFEDGGTCYKIK